MILIGNKIPKSITIGGEDVSSIAIAGETVWNKQVLIESPLRVVNNVAGSAITVTLTRNGSPANIDMEYSTDNVNWHTWTETNRVRSMSVPQNGNLYLRGNNPNGLNPTSSDSDYYSFTADKKYAMAGDIRSLVSRYEIDDLPNSCFRRLFFNSTTLYNASYMRLPAKKPGRWAYLHLFNGCTGLVSAPHELPATNLVNSNNVDGRCYGFMFKRCTSLTTMPIIRATKFGYQTCYEMFRECPSLIQQWATATPSDSSTTNVSFTIESGNNDETQCFYGMFYGCTALVDASGITATKTTDWHTSVCQNMFYGCTSLTSAPSITFGSFASGYSHCQQMFRDCTSLVSTPNIHLDAPTLYALTYKNMYRGCTRLTTAPEIKATTLTDSGTNHENSSLAAMFYGCTALTYIKVHFTNWNNGYYTQEWTYGLPSSGRFDCPSGLAQTKNASGNTTNPHYIPYDWSINQNKLAKATVAKTSGRFTFIGFGNEYSYATLRFTTGSGSTAVSGVTYYVNWSSSSSVTNPTTTNYNYKLEGTGTNSQVSEEFGGKGINRVYIKVLSVKSGYANSDILSADFPAGE